MFLKNKILARKQYFAKKNNKKNNIVFSKTRKIFQFRITVYNKYKFKCKTRKIRRMFLKTLLKKQMLFEHLPQLKNKYIRKKTNKKAQIKKIKKNKNSSLTSFIEKKEKLLMKKIYKIIQEEKTNNNGNNPEYRLYNKKKKKKDNRIYNTLQYKKKYRHKFLQYFPTVIIVINTV